jgi:GNAT superfamily N-acetyltransferase
VRGCSCLPQKVRVPARDAASWWSGLWRDGRCAGEAEGVGRFVIRDAVPGDMGALRGVFRRSSLSNEGDRMNLLAHPDALELSDLAVQQRRTRAAVAESGIAGFATWLSGQDALEIEDLFVDPDWMGQGIGRALVADLIAIARGRGARRVEVTANQHALAFYEKAGFLVDHQVETRFGPAPRMHLEVMP